MKLVKDIDDKNIDTKKVSDKEAEEAIRTILSWMGEDPKREGLLETPKRVTKAFNEFFSGYKEDPDKILSKTFEEVAGYDEMVVIRDIRLESHCEHHMVPILGKAHVAYIPEKRVVGISKLARIVDCYAKRLQTQETMTAQIASCIQRVLLPRGVAVVVDAAHQCMTTRGVQKSTASTITSRMLGLFRTDARTRMEFMNFIGK